MDWTLAAARLKLRRKYSVKSEKETNKIYLQNLFQPNSATSKLDPSFCLQFFVAVVKQINSCHIVMKTSCKSN